MTSVAQETKSQAVTLKGSAMLVKEFFNYGVNSILYQRGIYPQGKAVLRHFHFVYLLTTLIVDKSKFSWEKGVGSRLIDLLGLVFPLRW